MADNKETNSPVQGRPRGPSRSNISMPPELFEKLYLQPQTAVKGDLRSRFGNPTPLGLTGFVVGLTPLSACLMGWRGSGAFGVANIGVFFFIGGPLLFIASILEFFLGNTFPFVVFGIYGGTFMALGATLQPFFASATAYSSTLNFYEGMAEPGFYASLAFFPVCVASLHILFMIASTRINAVFFGIFTFAGLGFFLFAGALWKSAEAAAVAADLQVAAGACLFVTSIFGWYLLANQILASTGFPFELPVGDFSRFWAARDGNKSDEESAERGAVVDDDAKQHSA